MKANLSEEEKTTLNGHMRKLARKHKVSQTYVCSIVADEVDIDTGKAAKIFADLKHVAEFFKPVA